MVSVRSWLRYYVYGSPRKDRNVCVCACPSVPVLGTTAGRNSCSSTGNKMAEFGSCGTMLWKSAPPRLGSEVLVNQGAVHGAEHVPLLPQEPCVGSPFILWPLCEIQSRQCSFLGRYTWMLDPARSETNQGLSQVTPDSSQLLIKHLKQTHAYRMNLEKTWLTWCNIHFSPFSGEKMYIL